MLSYNELYDLLRKEKYSETLQQIDKSFLLGFNEYLRELRTKISTSDDIFSDSAIENKKQLENSIALFRGIILRRKKKLLNLVFVAAETGIMKRDYETMLEFEKKMFDNLVKAFENGDKELSSILNGRDNDKEPANKMIIFNESVEQFIDMNGNAIGPFGKGELANLDSKICEVLIGGGKATFVD